MKKKIFTVKKGYSDIAQFETLTEATKFFSDIVQNNVRGLDSVNSGKEKAYFWGKKVEFGLEIEELDIYPSKKEAEFAVFKGEKEE